MQLQSGNNIEPTMIIRVKLQLTANSLHYSHLVKCNFPIEGKKWLISEGSAFTMGDQKVLRKYTHEQGLCGSVCAYMWICLCGWVCTCAPSWQLCVSPEYAAQRAAPGLAFSICSYTRQQRVTLRLNTHT